MGEHISTPVGPQITSRTLIGQKSAFNERRTHGRSDPSPPWIFIRCVEAAKLASSRTFMSAAAANFLYGNVFICPYAPQANPPRSQIHIYTQESARAAVCVRVYFSLDLLLWVSMVTAGPERAGELRIAARRNGQSKISTGTVLLTDNERTACVCVAPGCLLFWVRGEERKWRNIIYSLKRNSFVDNKKAYM